MNISTLRFNNRGVDEAISVKKYLEVLEYFNKNLVVGVELERAVPQSRDELYRRLGMMNTRTGSAGTDFRRSPSNRFNVAMIKGDPSIGDNWGNELLFGGSNESFAWIQERHKRIEKMLDEASCETYKSTCSNHISVLTLQDKLIPALVLKNTWNLTRAFSSALYWLSSGDPINIFRSGGADNYARPRIAISPAGIAVRDFLQNMTKYSQCNLSKNVTLDSRNNPETTAGLFAEFRGVDGFRVPTALTALMFLHRAIVYKAVDLSRKGVLLVESVPQWTENKMESSKIRNRQPDVDEEFLKAHAERLLSFLAPELKQMSTEALEILNKLAVTPVSKMAMSTEGRNWHKKVEAMLCKRKVVRMTDREEQLLTELLDAQITATSATMWKKRASRRLRIPVRTIEYILKNVDAKSGMRVVFDKDFKRYVLAKG